MFERAIPAIVMMQAKGIQDRVPGKSGVLDAVHPLAKAEQLERDFGVRHPLLALRVGLTRRLPFYKEITPLQSSVGDDRFADLAERGYDTEDAIVILLMRGARLESLADTLGEDVDDLADRANRHLRGIDPVDLIPEAQRLLDLSWRIA